MAESFRAIVTLLDRVEPGHPDHELPGIEAPVDPGFGISADRPALPIVTPPADGPITLWPPQVDNSLPRPPPGIWGGHPDNSLPGLPPSINNDLPVFPGTPENPIAAPPGVVWPPLPVHPPADDSTVVVIAWVPGAGWRYVVVDLSLKVDGGPALTPEPK